MLYSAAANQDSSLGSITQEVGGGFELHDSTRQSDSQYRE
jgi:hypothetical protein